VRAGQLRILTMADYTTSELMVARASKELASSDVVFVGIGVPSLAVNLAYRMHAPGLCMIYESGAVGCVPTRLPISIGDPCLVTGSLAVVPMPIAVENSPLAVAEPPRAVEPLLLAIA